NGGHAAAAQFVLEAVATACEFGSLAEGHRSSLARAPGFQSARRGSGDALDEGRAARPVRLTGSQARPLEQPAELAERALPAAVALRQQLAIDEDRRRRSGA